MRTPLAWLLSLVGVGAAGYGLTLPWFDNRTGTTIPLTSLVTGLRHESASLLLSMALPVGIAAILTVIGLLMGTLLLRLGGGLLVATVVVWIVQSREAVDIGDLQTGIWNVAFGSLLILVAGALK